jgi:hypothetical protein
MCLCNTKYNERLVLMKPNGKLNYLLNAQSRHGFVWSWEVRRNDDCVCIIRLMTSFRRAPTIASFVNIYLIYSNKY